MLRLTLLLFAAITLANNANAEVGRPRSYFDKQTGSVICKEPVPEFTLDYDSNPSTKEVKELCSCIWKSFPQGRWERDTMITIFKGQDPGWRTQGLVARFGKAVKKCGGYDL
tara:strand:+ start:161 stop:496 length:336 start_codon:yes stop_codon:yes gene_type:complete